MIDLSSIKPGDKVTVELTIKRPHAAGFVTQACNGDHLYVEQPAILSHTPAPREIKVGDRVMRDVSGICAEAEVIGIHRAQAWLLVRSNDQAFVTEIADVTKLRHAPPSR